MSDDPPPRNDPLLSANSTETPALSDQNGGSKWFALFFVGFLVFNLVLYFLFIVM